MQYAKNGIPRRNCLYLCTPAERAIYETIQEVEKVGAHPLLTEAVILLGQAKERVANFVELSEPFKMIDTEPDTAEQTKRKPKSQTHIEIEIGEQLTLIIDGERFVGPGRESMRSSKMFQEQLLRSAKALSHEFSERGIDCSITLAEVKKLEATKSRLAYEQAEVDKALAWYQENPIS